MNIWELKTIELFENYLTRILFLLISYLPVTTNFQEKLMDFLKEKKDLNWS